MSIFEIIAVTSTLLCVYLTAKQKILAWPVGIVGVIAFLIIFLQQGLYAMVGLQLIFLMQGIYGWYNWARGKGDKELPVTKVSRDTFIFHISVVISLSFIFGYLLDNTTESSVPYLDAGSSFLSLLANWYLTKKILQSWYIWIFVNILLFTLFMLQELYLSALMEIILWGMAINGLILWKRNIKEV